MEQHRIVRAPKVMVALLFALAAAFTVLGTAWAATTDTSVTDREYVKANGAPPDATTTSCSTNNRQQNEPSAAVNPSNPNTIVAGSNDYCTAETTGGTWTGFYRSTDGGSSWTDGLLPGYPGDNSPEGKASPLQQRGIVNAGDPVQEWDNNGRVFYMGNAFNRGAPQYGSVWVATYDQNANHYVRTVIVGKGTPAVNGKFNDKTAIGVDRGVKSPNSGNVYAAWSLFQGQGNNSIRFVRSTDHGKTFSNPMKISEGVKDNQFADVAVTSDGTVYVTWRQFESKNGQQDNAVVFVKSTDGGKHFTKPAVVKDFESFDAADSSGNPQAAQAAAKAAFKKADGPGVESGAEEESAGDARDCGSGPFVCKSGFTFFRHDSQPRSTADPKGDPNTVYVVFDAIKPGTKEPSNSTYNTAEVENGQLTVGQGAIYFVKTTNGGKTWSAPSLISNSPTGHQFFPDINADGGYLHAVWHDSRNDASYSVQNAIGDTSAKDPYGFHTASQNGLDTYGATSTDGGKTWGVTRLSSVSQNPDYEMFGDRRVPFQGDYNYVSSVGAFSYNVWTDNRDVKPGDDPRYNGGEGFDVFQCRTKSPDGSYSSDTCPNAGGLDQNIYGAASGQ